MNDKADLGLAKKCFKNHQHWWKNCKTGCKKMWVNHNKQIILSKNGMKYC